MPDPTAPAVAPDVAELTNPQIARRLYEFTLERGDYEKNHDEVTHEFVDFVEDNLPKILRALDPKPDPAAEIARLCEEVAELQEREEGFLCALRRIADHEDARDSIKAIAYSELSRT